MITLSWASLIAAMAVGGIVGAGVATLLCFCAHNPPPD